MITRAIFGGHSLRQGIAAALGLTVVLSAVAQDMNLTAISRDVPSFELTELNADTWTPESFDGKPYVVNFWATWCAPCVHELPSMNRAAEQLLPEGVGMVAINLGEEADLINNFLEEVPIDFPVLLGNPMTFPNWEVKGMPTTYIVSADGKLIAEAVGPREWDTPEFIDYMLSLR